MTDASLDPVLDAGMTFGQASAAVVEYLKSAAPMGAWAVTRLDPVGDRQLFLEIRDDSYGFEAGATLSWTDSLCRRMVAGAGPRIAPDAMNVAAYAMAPPAAVLPIGAYAGYPIVGPDGELFGTICAYDPQPQGARLAQLEPLLSLLTVLLATVLDADISRTAAARSAEVTQTVAETDFLTGLANRRGWDRHLAAEEDRYRRFGESGSIVIVDLDGLKDVNDSLGHAAGDLYLRAAGETLRRACRSGDVVARLGGDEFGIIAGQTPDDRIAGYLDRLRAALEEAGSPGSVGAAPYTIAGGFAGAWERADAAMYVEKSARRRARIPADSPGPGH